MSETLNDNLKIMDCALNEYYCMLQRNDYYSNGIGKFSVFCHENGIDATDIEDELKENASNCLLTDFDAQFPFHESVKINNENERLKKILEVLKYCYKYQKVTDFNSIVDFDIFKSKDTKCEGPDQCSYLLRIIYSLKHYQTLVSSSIDEANQKRKFVQFCVEEYRMCLNDYIHLISVHSTDLATIANNLQTNFGFHKCYNIDECKCTQRHRRRRNKNDPHELDDKYNFYVEIFDTIHFYLFHLEDLGLRILNKPNKIDENNTKKNIVGSLHFIDEEIKFIQNEIQTKNKKYGLNYNTNSKFVIQQTEVTAHYINAENTDEKESTFIDDMVSNLRNDNKNDVAKLILDDFSSFMLSEEYDTDSIQADIAICDDKGCNILYALNNDKKWFEATKALVKYFNITSHSFSTGFRFWYHTYYQYQNAEKIKNEQIYSWQQNDFGGVSPDSLYVPEVLKSVKEEVLASSFITVALFKEKVIEKGNLYIDSEKCRNIKNVHGTKNGGYDPLHYGIGYAAPLRKSHLHSLLLYCDFTDFCTDFSSTFRRLKSNEQIETVKQRNSKYHHIAKNLAELIQYYGIRGGSGNNNGQENGPFYTGLSFCMNIPEFSIRLNGPTSTSKQKEIAMRFSGSEGIIIKLNNRTYPGRYEAFFNSSWISCYPEEDERVFFSAQYKIEIQSIIVIETKKNYQAIISAFYKFDSMLSGQKMTGLGYKAVTKTDVAFVGLSVEYVLGNSSNDYKNKLSNDCKNKLDTYIKDTFYLFTKKKTQITLHLELISRIQNDSFIELIAHSIKPRNYKRNMITNNNLFKPILFKLFPNLQEIMIYSTSFSSVYSFSILSLLSMLTNTVLPKSFRTITIKDSYPDKSGEWLKKKFTAHVKRQFIANKLSIQLKRNQSRNKKEDWIVIKKNLQ
eukprot:505222_1